MIKIDLKRHRKEIIGSVVVLLILLGGMSVFKYTSFNSGFEMRKDLSILSPERALNGKRLPQTCSVGYRRCCLGGAFLRFEYFFFIIKHILQTLIKLSLYR